MEKTKEWWSRMVEMHAKLMGNFDVDILRKFKEGLDDIHYVYAKPYEGLGKWAPPVGEIAGWYDDVSEWSSTHEDYDAAVNYLERALDYYCDPVLEYDDDTIDEAKNRMDNLVANTIIGIYEGFAKRS